MSRLVALFHSFIQLSVSHYHVTVTLPVIGEIKANKKELLFLSKSEYRAGNYVTPTGCDFYALVHLHRRMKTFMNVIYISLFSLY